MVLHQNSSSGMLLNKKHMWGFLWLKNTWVGQLFHSFTSECLYEDFKLIAVSNYRPDSSKVILSTLKRLGSANLTLSPLFFPKLYLLERRWSLEIPEVIQKIWRFSPSILTILNNFSDFLTFPCYKETNDVSI